MGYTLCSAQVRNDSIAYRLPLLLDASIQSSTDNCTVEYSCINTEITHKCIKYHNDQWFEFTPPENGTYYINVSQQQCRDVLGIQLVCIDGRSCEPETHKVVACVSLANQDDVYLQLHDLKKETSYLLVVDGYLHDFCSFSIAVSSQPKGIPKNSTSEAVSQHARLTKNNYAMEWVVDPEQSKMYEQYTIYRWKETEKTSVILAVLAHETNTFGESIVQYSWTDTLVEKGIYFYSIVALTKEDKNVLIAEYKTEVSNIEHRPFSTYHLQISQSFKKSTPLDILIEDKLSGTVIVADQLPASKDHQKFYTVKDAVDKGITQFRVTIMNVHTGKKTTYDVDWNRYRVKP